MGEVWLATDLALDRLVALKRARSERPGDNDGIRREAQLVAGLSSHPNIVTLHDTVEHDKVLWLVMEYVESDPATESLKDRLTARGPLPWRDVASIGERIAAALAYVHGKGYLHRDVTPGNILLADDRVMLTDFGMARRTSSGRSTDKDIVGTVLYLSPEVAQGHEPTAESDVYSLGAALYTAVEGVPPHGDDDNPLAILNRATTGEFVPPRHAGPLEPVLTEMLHKIPAARPSAARAQLMLRDVVAGEPVGSGNGRPAPNRLRRALTGTRRRPVVVAASVAVVAAAVVAATIIHTPDHGAEAAHGSSTLTPVLGDPHTADPCGLVDPDPLARYGEARLTRYFGAFNRCDVLIATGDTEVDVEVLLNTASAGNGRTGSPDVTRLPESDGVCPRTVWLADASFVHVLAKTDDDVSNLCDIADTATGTATGLLSEGNVPRRSAPFPVDSLALVDACALLNPDDRSVLSGLDAATAEPGYASWSCGWDAEDMSVNLRFDRNEPLGARDGQLIHLADRDAYVKPTGDGPDTCMVRIPTRTFPNESRDDMVELVILVVQGPGSPDALCEPATELAAAVDRNLP